jgi:succinoglycan biosynthesis transport protein ExoP
VRQQTDVYHNPHLEFLQSEVKTTGDRLMVAQNALDDFKQKWRISDYDQEVTELLKRRGEVDNNLQNAQANLVLAQHKRGELQKLIKDIPKTQSESAGGDKYRSYDDAQTRLADLRTKRSQMLATYNAGSPALATLDAGIAAADREVRARQRDLEQRSNYVNTVYQTVQTDLLRTSADASSNTEPVRVLAAQISAIDQRLEDMRKVRGTYNTLTRDLQLAEATYKSLSTTNEDSRVKESLNQQRISAATIISKPSAPYRTARPRKLVTLLACIFAGAILGAGAALIMEFLDDSFTTPDQMTTYLELPVLASFPRQTRKLPLLLPVARGVS